MKYVVGLLFSDDLKDICLVEKKRPEWQKSFFNGPGGKVNKHETMHSAMSREFFEETSVEVPATSWRHVLTQCEAATGVYVVEYFALSSSNFLSQVETMTDEAIYVFRIAELVESSLIYPLQWVIPLAKALLAGKSDKETLCIR